MRNLSLLLLFTVLLSSCIEEDSHLVEEEATIFTEKTLFNLFEQPCSGTSGATNLYECSFNGPLPYKMPPSTHWPSFNSQGSGDIDYELEKFFDRYCEFSNFCKINYGIITSINYGEVVFSEDPTFTIDPIIGDTYIYNYLSDTHINSFVSGEILGFLICKIREYRDVNFPNSHVSDVSITTDNVLCNTSSIPQARVLRVSFTLTSYL